MESERKIEAEFYCTLDDWIFFVFLPARFDWSIIGCTILLLALMNLAEREERKEKQKGKR